MVIFHNCLLWNLCTTLLSVIWCHETFILYFKHNIRQNTYLSRWKLQFTVQSCTRDFANLNTGIVQYSPVMHMKSIQTKLLHWKRQHDAMIMFLISITSIPRISAFALFPHFKCPEHTIKLVYGCLKDVTVWILVSKSLDSLVLSNSIFIIIKLHKRISVILTICDCDCSYGPWKSISFVIYDHLNNSSHLSKRKKAKK